MKKGLFYLVVFGVLLYYGYQAGVDYASSKIVDELSSRVANGHDINISQFNKIPEVESLLEKYQVDGIEEIDESQLVYHSKEEVLKDVVSKFGLSEIKDMLDQIQNDFSEEKQIEMLDLLKEKLSEEELESIKVIVLQELLQQQSRSE